MNRPEPIELENNLGPDAVTGEINRVPWMAYDVDEMDIYIAEKDKEIAELKDALERDFIAKKSAEKVLRDLLDCGLIKEWFYNGTFHAVLKADDPHLEIAELKAENERLKEGKNDYKQFYQDDFKEIESLKASHYAEMVDAGMRERRLKRALWLSRAERANEKQKLFYFSLAYNELCIDGFYNPSSGRRELSPKQWIKVFNKVENKCRAKADEYK